MSTVFPFLLVIHGIFNKTLTVVYFTQNNNIKKEKKVEETYFPFIQWKYQ